MANGLGAELVCDAESGGSNPRIVRTTREWIAQNKHRLDDTVVIIQWTTWEREEWLWNNVWYQVNASGIDSVPKELEQRYKDYIVGIDWNQKTQQAHQNIWDMHLYLKELGLRHLFFSGHSTFSDIQNHFDWGINYMYPYSRENSYHNWLKNNGGTYSNAQSYHFDAKSHRLWADFVLHYINDNNLIVANEIPAD